MAAQTPTIVLVHGAWADAMGFDAQIRALQQEGFRAVGFANPLRELDGDAAYLAEFLRTVTGPIVLVGHSYGGMVITEAAAGNDAVVALVYVNAFAPDHGESAFQLSTMYPGGAGPDAFTAVPLTGVATDLAIRRELFHPRFCADVPEEVAALMAATQRPATQEALSEPLPADVPAWKQIPSWFVLGDRDLIIPAALHRHMAERAGARGTREIAGASHAIMVSNPDAVAASILDAVVATMPAPVANA